MAQITGASQVLRLGTRGSLLARTQSQLIADELMKIHTGLRIELVIVKTTGDRITDKALHEIGGKGLFTKEIEIALINGEIDFAVHSFKDVPVTMPLVEAAAEKLVIAAVPKREDPRDVMIMHKPDVVALADRAVVGSSSLRRRCQILDASPKVRVVALRGNIDTRLRKLRAGEFDVVILAMAGLLRAGLYDPSYMKPLPVDQMLPAAGQGALALQCRRDDSPTRAILSNLNDPVTEQCVAAERAVVRALNGDCHSPIAALATFHDKFGPGMFNLRVTVGQPGGEPPVKRAEISVKPADFTPETFAAAVVTALQPAV
jgi:hydroxymethylbilane synthase